jgi:hypothetical protein
VLRKATIVLMLLLLPAVVADAAERKGFLIGFSLGGGTLNSGDSWGAGAIAFYLGGSVSKNAALAVDFVGVLANESSATLMSSQTALVLQYWVSPRVWIGGGPGYGQNGIDIDNVQHWGSAHFAVVLEGGVEVWQRGHFALDLRGRYGRTFTEPQATSHVVASVGFTWY